VIQDFPSIYDLYDLKKLEEATASFNEPRMRELIETQNLLTPDPPPYVYALGTVRAWDVRRETRTDAKKRIMDEVERQVERHLDEQERIAKLLYFDPSPDKQKREHYAWLVLYQIEEMRYAAVARKVNEGRGSEPLTENTIRIGIKDAANLIIGPGWQDWLRPGEPGRPKRS
jgi:hypothetical protein